MQGLLLGLNISLMILTQKGKSVLMTFANDIKLEGIINIEENWNIVQGELNDLEN